MRSSTWRLEDLRNVILNLGFVGENLHTRQIFDCKKMFDQYPNASVSMTVTPPEGEPYPGTIERDGDLVIWDVRDSDLVAEGDGEIQLVFTQEPHIARSYNARTHICRSQVPTGSIPSGLDDYITRANQLLDEAEAATAAAEAAAEHQPIIDDNGYWAVWDADAEEYVATEYKAQGTDGQDGVGIVSIEKTGTSGLVDTYTITFTSGNPVTYTVTNGRDADPAELIDDTSTATNKTWSAKKISDENSSLLTEITNGTNLAKNGFLYTDAKCSTFTNKFNVRGMNGQGIKVVGDEVIGSATAFGSSYDANPYPVSCDANTRYTLALDAYTEQNESGASKNGMLIDFLYSDGTTSSSIIYLNCSYATWKHYTLTSSSNKTIVGVRFKSNYYPSNIWHLKNIMLAVGTTETTFIPYYIPKDNEARERVATAEVNIQRLQTIGREHLNDDIKFFYGGINTNSGADYTDVNNAYVKTDFLSNVSRITVASGYAMTIVNFTENLEYISKTAVSGGIWKMEDAPSNMRYIRINMSKSGGINISNIHSLVSVYQTEEAYGSEIKDIQKCNPCAVKEYTYTGERISLSHKMSSELFNTKMDITGGQDGVILGNEMFIFNSSGAFVVMDCVTREKLGTGTLEDPISGKYPHVNSASQSNEVNESNYNYLYLNAYNNEGFPKGTCYVYSISKSGVTYTATVVQTITIGFTEETIWDGGSSVRPYGNFVVDTDNDALYVFTVHSSSTIRFFKFDLPSLASASVTLTQADIKDQFDVDGTNFQYPQGCTYANGKLFALSGFSGSGCLHVIDLEKEKEVTTIQLSTIGINSEPEFASEYKGDLIVDSYSNFMRLKF